MAFTLGEKCGRVIKFLIGLRNPKVATALAAHGFGEGDMAEGWSLVNGLGAGKLAILPVGPRDLEAIQKLDTFENLWFPIASASLERRHPAVHARFFQNLSQAEGFEVAVTVKTFVDRYEALSNADGPFGAEGEVAKKLLDARGITQKVMDEAKVLLASLAKVREPGVPFSMEEQEEELARAEDRMWAWYLEWSQVARIAIKQRALLRQLGFLNSRRSSEDDEQEETGAPATGGSVAAPNAGGVNASATRA